MIFFGSKLRSQHFRHILQNPNPQEIKKKFKQWSHSSQEILSFTALGSFESVIFFCPERLRDFFVPRGCRICLVPRGCVIFFLFNWLREFFFRKRLCDLSLSVCSLLMYRLNVFLPPLPQVRCPILLEKKKWSQIVTF